MGTAYSADVSGQNIEVDVFPATKYCSAGFSLRGSFGAFQLFADNEHLAEIEFALRTYLNGIRYPESPSQQAILHHESNQSIKEESA
ncbi:hypothetical protein [Fontibacillus sp. BL9]|uniref:hypothetical protein n=1 Tax=Fontibacillus sp. BL9 TaxID=3389971 RepID=UPI00397AB55E